MTGIGPAPPLGGNLGFITVKPLISLAPLVCSEVLLGGSGGTLWGGQRSPEGSQGSPWGLGVALGGPWGSLGATLGGPRGSLRNQFCKRCGIAKSSVLHHKMVHVGPWTGRWRTLGGASSQRRGAEATRRDPRDLKRGTWMTRGDPRERKRRPKGNKQADK